MMQSRSGTGKAILTGIFAVCMLVLGVLEAAAYERITDYQVVISVHKDRHVDISEYIEVEVEGNIFQRGLLRDIPVIYRSRDGSVENLSPKIHAIKRNGQDEPYQTSHDGRYFRIRIGDANIFLPHQRHRYEIHYSVEDSIGFFENYDEIYWNAIGDEWAVGIDQAKVTVRLPDGAEIKDYSVYTGRAGQKGDNYQLVEKSAGEVTIRSNHSLPSGEGITIAVAWQKGIVEAPSEVEQAWNKFVDNSPIMVLILAALAQLAWLYSAWRKVGRDPEGGAIFPRFHPPAHVSPAVASYVTGLGSFQKSSQTSFMAALVDLAIKGFVSFVEGKGRKSDMTVRRESSAWSEGLPAGEKALFATLMRGSDSVRFSDMQFNTMARIMRAFTGAVERETDQVYFRRNTAYLVPGFILAFLGILGFIVLSVGFASPFTFPFFELVSAAVISGFLLLVIRLVNAARGKGTGFRLGKLSFVPFMVIVFLGAIVSSEISLNDSLGVTNILAVIVIILMVLGLAFFSDWMKAPTKLGREMLDEIEGLKMFMTVTAAQNAQQAEAAGMPELTPKLYEDLLPYAIALGVERKWSRIFEEKVFSQLPPDQQYHPHWYVGHFDPMRPTQSLAHITETIGTDLSSAMTPPATQSSGSFGGGMSGGGGGGGGGGGW
ncbi:DUF2207 family protein [uncultured Cohaesibacter sp.]|uniref:DUF2207 domain-containing protein n=1 Tax=uncultured Cohaesibacter sp. TaxID=1002546 RepID=UPI00292CF400|nr:DUF2207 domain-containing protein [uncultured Cohaesibacter sp.]